MGRTNPTFRDVLRSLQDSWRDYRRALRRPDQHRFDRLWEDARGYADAGGYLNHQNPMVVVLFSMVLAQEKRIEDLEAELAGSRADDGRAGGSRVGDSRVGDSRVSDGGDSRTGDEDDSRVGDCDRSDSRVGDGDESTA